MTVGQCTPLALNRAHECFHLIDHKLGQTEPLKLPHGCPDVRVVPKMRDQKGRE